MSDPSPQGASGYSLKALPALRSREMWYYFGPAFVASVAYIDPGNFATNIQGGTEFGYSLLWVLLWSNAMAILIQYLAAKLGIASGRSLPQNCREQFSRPVTLCLWAAAELGAVATDLAEFLGAALGMYLLFGWNLLLSAVITGIIVFLILALELYGFRKLEYAILVFVFGIAACYAVEISLVSPDWKMVGLSTILPRVSSGSIYIAVSMLGATVMPHVIYLHSSLVQSRVREDQFRCPTGQRLQKFKHLRYELIDVLAAMNAAWLINSAMVIMAAAVFFHSGHVVTTIEEAHHTLGPLLGKFSALAFALALLMSGLASSTVGTMAGQVIIEGFLNIKFSIFLRRLLTMAPAILVIALKLDPLKILVLSQVVLSFVLPFAMVPLIVLTRQRKVMSDLVNSPVINALAYLSTAVILGLNGLLLYQTFGGKF